MKRRDVLKAAFVLGAAGGWSRSAGLSGEREDDDADFVVVGSGAGGGTVAARLVEAGYSVLVLEAGGDPRPPDPANYDVPAFHPFSTEDAAIRWDFFVRHYADQAQQERDPNFVPEQNGIWYPRAGTLGGCTAHNALILMSPSNADWDQIADLTGDPSWRSTEMWTYFERVREWLPAEKAAAPDVVADGQARRVIARSVGNALKEFGAPSLTRLEALVDPNARAVVDRDDVGARYTPLTTDNHQRAGSRERLRSVEATHRGRLRIELNALATRVIFDDGNRAVGVEYQKGERLYGADPQASSAPAETRIARARREVILAGGAFNTPQLLMLSGIGDPDVLAACGIRTRVALRGVGRNLQDRYEVPVVNRMKRPWDMLDGATFTTRDPQFRRWRNDRRGVYTSNGALVCVVQRSGPGKQAADLFCYALIADFRGYKPGYSEAIRRRHDVLTWVVLKGHTNNRGGSVTITSPNPRARPAINFRYFQEGTDREGDDLRSVVSGIRLVRRMTAGMKPDLIAEEELPGDTVTSDADLERFVRNHAWGHHASCTCAIGSEAGGGVLASDFKVHRTQGLRVVDASVFPRVPGLFIVSAIYMIGEKAADAIIRANRN